MSSGDGQWGTVSTTRSGQQAVVVTAVAVGGNDDEQQASRTVSASNWRTSPIDRHSIDKYPQSTNIHNRRASPTTHIQRTTAAANRNVKIKYDDNCQLPASTGTTSTDNIPNTSSSSSKNDERRGNGAVGHLGDYELG